MTKTLGKELLWQLQIFTLLLLGFLFIVATFSIRIDWLNNITFFEKYIYQHRFFTDFFQFCAITILLLSGNTIFRILGAIIGFIFTFFYFIQSQSFSTTGNFLPSIALENADHADFLDLDKIILSGLVWLFIFLLACCLIYPCLKNVSLKSALIMAVTLIIISALIKNDKHWLNEETINSRFAFYNSGKPRIENVSPLSALYETFREYYSYLKKQFFINQNAAVLSAESVNYLYENYQGFGELDSHFNLVRNLEFDEKLDFISQANVSDGTSQQQMNVIVFFIEGMSARLVESYSDTFPGLTPNIKEFSEKVIKVNNYYNHTYATYRGIGGQLCSIFPMGRLFKNTNYRCLNHMLKDHGYESRFMVSQDLQSTGLDSIAYSAGFDNVDGASEINKLLSLSNAEYSSIVPDRVLIDGLIKHLTDLEQSNNEKPVFIGLYNFETHTGATLIEKNTTFTGTTQTPRTEPSRLLDTFHNIDKEFGRFWQYFKTSSLYENTIVVLTSDHATYPSVEYVHTLSGIRGYQPIFIDNIPLLIYHPNLMNSIVINANRSTSLDFAPSILHLLGISNVRAPFLGSSLFSSDKTSPFAETVGISTAMWFMGEHNIWRRITDNKKETRARFPEEVKKLELLQYLESLEKSNKLWPADNRFN